MTRELCFIFYCHIEIMTKHCSFVAKRYSRNSKVIAKREGKLKGNEQKFHYKKQNIAFEQNCIKGKKKGTSWFLYMYTKVPHNILHVWKD